MPWAKRHSDDALHSDVGRQVITILHLSDMQFGKNHRFGQLAEGGLDAEFNTLAQRLIDDLQELRDGEFQLQPDLLAVAGDIAEWGRPKEFHLACDFFKLRRMRIDKPPELPKKQSR